MDDFLWLHGSLALLQTSLHQKNQQSPTGTHRAHMHRQQTQNQLSLKRSGSAQGVTAALLSGDALLLRHTLFIIKHLQTLK